VHLILNAESSRTLVAGAAKRLNQAGIVRNVMLVADLFVGKTPSNCFKTIFSA